MIYVYAITDRPDSPLPAETGLGGSLLNIPYRDIAAVVSSLTTSQVPATENNLWAHETVVEGLVLDRAVLPLRFGTVFPDRVAVEASLSEHYADFTASLERVRGRVELGLRVLWKDDVGHGQEGGPSSVMSQDSASGSGRAYLLSRLEQDRRIQTWRQRGEALAAEINAPLAGLSVEHTQQVLTTHRLLLTAAYLVRREDLTAFQRQVEAVSVAYPALSFLCTGPWPPYSFVTTTLQTEERTNVNARN
jgi:gas vesicle protein GvpL/GvpF